MPSYRLIRRILSEVNAQKVSDPIDEDEFVFLDTVFREPARTISELRELDRLGYIQYVEPKKFVPMYPLFHWKQIILLGILRYIGYSIATPVLVTLATLWIKSLLQAST